MREIIPSLVIGMLFGAGLAVSDMVNPARVLAFLDLAGRWDPTLAFVMGGALVPAALGYVLVRRMRRPLFAERFGIPERGAVDRQLLVGAAVFGVGWGLVGLCPGPAISGLVYGLWELWLFAAAMVAGMLLHRLVTTKRRSRSSVHALTADS